MHDGSSFSFAVLYLITKRIRSCVKFSEDGEMLPEWGAENVATISWFFFRIGNLFHFTEFWNIVMIRDMCIFKQK